MSQSYDVRPSMLALTAIARAAFVPATLNIVYDDIPKLFSDASPVGFVEYRGGTNKPDDEEQIQTATRIYRVDFIALQALVTEIDTADQLTKGFAGAFYDLLRLNPTLSGTVDKAVTVDDKVQSFPVNGGGGKAAEYLANMLTVEITVYFV